MAKSSVVAIEHPPYFQEAETQDVQPFDIDKLESLFHVFNLSLEECVLTYEVRRVQCPSAKCPTVPTVVRQLSDSPTVRQSDSGPTATMSDSSDSCPTVPTVPTARALFRQSDSGPTAVRQFRQLSDSPDSSDSKGSGRVFMHRYAYICARMR